MKCPGCKGEMKALFTSMYCAHAVSPALLCKGACISIGGKRWRAERIRVGGKFPPWATRGWNLNGPSAYEDPTRPTEELLRLLESYWQSEDEPGWDASERTWPSTGMVCEVLAFAPLDD